MSSANADDAVARQGLYDTLFEVGTPLEKIARASAIAKHRDPRMTKVLVELVTGQHCSRHDEVAKFWKPLFGLLVACGDPRIRTVVETQWAKFTTRGFVSVREKTARARIEKLCEKLVATYPDEPPTVDDATAATALLECLRSTKHAGNDDRELEAALLAAVYAAPDDDGPRAVYADWLQERNDPRGEFIALQLRDATDKRAKDLLAVHEEAWSAPLGIKSAEFARGFPVQCFTWSETIATNHAWATVADVHGSIPATDEFPMLALRRVHVTYDEAIVHLATLRSPPPIEVLECACSETREVLDAFASVVPRLTRLRRLEIRTEADNVGPEQFAWRWRDTTIRELSLRSSFAQLGAWLDAIRGSQLELFELVHGRGDTRARDRDRG